MRRIRWDPCSHATKAGYVWAEVKKAISGMWKRRAWLSLTELSEVARDTWLRARRSPLRVGPDYLPAFARA